MGFNSGFKGLKRLLKFRPTNANNCVRFTIKLKKPLTHTCFRPDWAIIREHNNYTKLMFDISISCMWRNCWKFFSVENVQWTELWTELG
jgi:hypothetical protein